MQSAIVRAIPKRFPSYVYQSRNASFTDKAKQVAETVKDKLIGAKETAEVKGHELGVKAKQVGREAKEKLSEMSSDAKHKACDKGGAKDKACDMGESAKTKSQELAKEAKEKLSEAGQKAKEKIHRATE